MFVEELDLALCVFPLWWFGPGPEECISDEYGRGNEQIFVLVERKGK